MDRKNKRKGLLILNVLKDSEKPLTSARIAEKLELTGYDISERTIRLYLQRMEMDGLVATNGKKGSMITKKGLEELDSSWVIEKVGFLSARIDRMSYMMNFDLNTVSGTVVINVTLVEPRLFAENIKYIEKVYYDGYAMGNLLTFIPPGENLEHIAIPEGMIGIGTVCSITLNGVLLKYGIPTTSRFGGLLEIKDKKPVRFVEIIMYDGTSIDPLEVFIRSGMTNYMGAIKTGSGRIGASFREFPAESRDRVEQIAARLKRIGLGGLVGIGMPGQSFLDIPVSEGRVGAIVIGGLNPVSILEENGVRAYSRALAGLIDFSRLFHYEEMGERIKRFL
ncbi:MAG TPA: NrpR regulatory domain-containing protein [Syntrophorhabdaceae bacterium]|nr:NrpR regulatory domain-containing protein [Syntrophorhabdaceae bacterium]HOL05945.1 NrpR regulatory domain-containing protein [Syntrophorhabdaceae bacterium]HON86268.1 NrpR regulatory domain-containing protein [Syntrophorhabdaceae bacterium]HOT41846.1 NrpR regulatory domain-containing protein [Syntrophorhabdaceae bacterium]HPC67567.1 NrpR regulatory domain-containing protein [Syntrophorhabdaceae bacterium]